MDIIIYIIIFLICFIIGREIYDYFSLLIIEKWYAWKHPDGIATFKCDNLLTYAVGIVEFKKERYTIVYSRTSFSYFFKRYVVIFAKPKN
jgi:hypothetical protein